MYRQFFIVAVLVMAVSELSLAEDLNSGAKPPDFGVSVPPPAPAVGEAATGWIFLSYPQARFWTPLYHLRSEAQNPPSVCLWSNAKLNDHAEVIRAFEYSQRHDLSVLETSHWTEGVRRTHFVSVASNDILPVNGRLVRFEQADFPADYPQLSIPKNVIDAGLRWTDITDSVPPEVRPGKGWTLVLATPYPDKQSGQHRDDYKLFPDPNPNKAELNKRPYFVKVLNITTEATDVEKSHADIEIFAQISPLKRTTVRKLSVKAGEHIAHDGRTHRILKIVPPQKIEGIGNLIGWVEVEP